MSAWAAFWLCAAIFVIAEVVITLHGIDTFLWQFKTPAELEIQKRLASSRIAGQEKKE